MKTRLLMSAIVVAAMLAACSDPADKPATPPSSALPVSPPTAPSPALATDAWLGEWVGPEGTALRIEGQAGSYQLTIRNLDGPRQFTGQADGAVIRFQRDGVDESIQASSGDETGMKWLAGKSNCLRVRSGEGYCRE